MAAAGFGEENGSDAAAGRESFFSEADAFDAYGTGFGRQTAAEGDAKFLEPAILAAGDDGVRGARGFAGGRHDGEGSKFEREWGVLAGMEERYLAHDEFYCMGRGRVIASAQGGVSPSRGTRDFKGQDGDRRTAAH